MLAAEFVTLEQLARAGKEIGQLRIAAVGDEPRHGVASAPAARLADQVQERRLEVGQDDGTIARHGPDATAPARTQQERRGGRSGGLSGGTIYKSRACLNDILLL